MDVFNVILEIQSILLNIILWLSTNKTEILCVKFLSFWNLSFLSESVYNNSSEHCADYLNNYDEKNRISEESIKSKWLILTIIKLDKRPNVTFPSLIDHNKKTGKQIGTGLALKVSKEKQVIENGGFIYKSKE